MPRIIRMVEALLALLYQKWKNLIKPINSKFISVLRVTGFCKNHININQSIYLQKSNYKIIHIFLVFIRLLCLNTYAEEVAFK